MGVFRCLGHTHATACKSAGSVLSQVFLIWKGKGLIAAIGLPFQAPELNIFRSILRLKMRSGTVVYSGTGQGTEITLPVSEIGGVGIYFIKVNSVVKKLMVK